MKTKTSSIPWVTKPIVPEEVYTDRAEFLEYFHHAASEAPHRRTASTVLLGQRRMGKTEIFRRVVNQLFFEQDPLDPHAVVPVYFSFPDSQMDERTFARDYMENFIRYYVGFYTSQPDLIPDAPKGEKLVSVVEKSRSRYAFSRTLNIMLDWYDSAKTGDSVLPHRDALILPRRVSDIDDSTIVMFLDEFQNTRLPQYNFDIAGLMQEAVESPTCPHFVTGSAMSILGREIIGRGSLFGRFRSLDIEAMSNYHGTELALKAARYYGSEISEVMAPVLAQRCGCNPFYITAVIQQSAEMKIHITDEDALNNILAVDITSGFIWGELNDQVSRWIDRTNEHGITKWVLYLSALDENTDHEKRGRLDLERIQKELERREGKLISLDKIRDVLIRLSRGDLLEYLELGGWFRRVNDPILLEFLKVWGKIEVEGSDRGKVKDDLKTRYMKSERRISEYKGYLAEVHMSQVLLNSQKKTLPGTFFNTGEDIRVPEFTFVRHRYRPSSGKGREIDVIGAAGPEQWVCQSKWVTGDKIGIDVLRELVSQADMVGQDKDPLVIRMWLFAHNGLTREAEAFAEKHGILWSARKQFDELLAHLGLRKLPNI